MLDSLVIGNLIYNSVVTCNQKSHQSVPGVEKGKQTVEQMTYGYFAL